MSSILERMRDSNKLGARDATAEGAYERLMEYARTRAQEEVVGEIEARTTRAEEMTKRVQIEKDAAVSIKNAEISKNAVLSTEITRLNAELATVSRRAAARLQDGNDSTAESARLLFEAQGKVNTLELEVASLKGKLSAKPNKQTVVAAPAPMVIPEFESFPVRDNNGRIISVKIKPVGLN